MGDDNVVTLKEKSKLIFECSCGCQQWFVHEHGGIECCNCNEISRGITMQVKEELSE